MRKGISVATMCIVLALTPDAGWAWTVNNLGAAGGWDDINRTTVVTTVLDQSDYTLDMPAANVTAALTAAYSTWDSVEAAANLSFEFKADDGGNYDVFDGPADSAGPPWFNGTSVTLDADAHWRYADIVIGGFLPASYFGNPKVIAVTWSGKVSGDGSGKPTWHAEIFFNDAWSWTDDALAADADFAAGLPNLLIDLQTVALHELGHAIGLGHEDDVPSVMATYYDGSQRTLLADDIEGITALYSASGKGGKGGGNGGGKGKPDKLVEDGIEWYLTGVTYLDAPSGVVAIPEPCMLALCAAGALALLRRKVKS